MKTRKYFGHIFRYVRSRRKESYRTFAKVLGIHYSTLCRYEIGERTPSLAVTSRLVEISDAPDLQTLVLRAYNLK